MARRWFVGVGVCVLQADPPAIPEIGQAGICIQLAAPDAQSNAAKEEKFYDRVHLEQAEASLRPQTTGSTL